MTLLMVSPMALLMLAIMGNMYNNKKLNITIIVLSTIVFILSFTLLRTQTPIGDEQYMKAMIPHHSSAILVSENANFEDAEVKKLATQIIESQKKEIAEMKILIDKIEKRD